MSQLNTPLQCKELTVTLYLVPETEMHPRRANYI